MAETDSMHQAISRAGISTFYRSPTDITDLPSFSGATIGDFAIGPDFRFNYSLLQINGLALVTPSDPVLVDALLLGGFGLNLSIIQLSAVLGPHLAFDGGTRDTSFTLGARVGADLVLGRLSIGVNYLWDPDLSDGFGRRPGSGFFGASLLFSW